MAWLDSNEATIMWLVDDVGHSYNPTVPPFMPFISINSMINLQFRHYEGSIPHDSSFQGQSGLQMGLSENRVIPLIHLWRKSWSPLRWPSILDFQADPNITLMVMYPIIFLRMVGFSIISQLFKPSFSNHWYKSNVGQVACTQTTTFVGLRPPLDKACFDR